MPHRSPRTKTKSGFFAMPKIVRRFQKDDKGVTVVEFAILAVPFFMLLMAIIECSIMFFASQRLESVVDTVGRQVRVGIIDGTTTQQQIRDAICAQANIVLNCNNINFDMKVIADYDALDDMPKPVDGAIDPDQYQLQSPGPEQVVMVTAQYEWPVITNYMQAFLSDLANGNALLTAVTIFRTEPYGASSAAASG